MTTPDRTARTSVAIMGNGCVSGHIYSSNWFDSPGAGLALLIHKNAQITAKQSMITQDLSFGF